MDYLLDTHTFIWFIDGNNLLPVKVQTEILHAKNECFLSVASLWEIAVKHSMGKLALKDDFNNIIHFLVNNNIRLLPIEFRHLQTLTSLEFIHRDPFDRVIIAQAITDNLTILTVDKYVKQYPVKCLW